MNILFIEPRLGSADWGLNFNLGVASMAGILKRAKHKVAVEAIFKEEDIPRLLNFIEKFGPEIVGFSFTESTFLGVKKLAKIIKRRFPHIYLVAGGVYPIFAPQDIVACRDLDAVCLGEGEYALLSLIKNFHDQEQLLNTRNFWFRVGERIIKNIKELPLDINELPQPDREPFREKNLDYYQGSLFFLDKQKGGFFAMSRGCLFACSYCASPVLALKSGGFSRYYRLLDPRRGVQQILEAQAKYHYDYLIFLDDIFSLNQDWFFRFTELYKKEVKLPYHCQLRVGTFNQETVKQLARSGCDSIAFGLESGDPQIRALVLNRQITDSQIKESVAWLKKYKIKICSYNMLGVPFETPQKFLKTIKLNAEIDVDKPYVFIFHPYKGTKLYDTCVENKLLIKQTKSFVDREDTLLRMPYFPREDILYYWRSFFLLLELAKATKARGWSRIWKRWLFWIYALPPSSTPGKWRDWAFNLARVFSQKSFQLKKEVGQLLNGKRRIPRFYSS